MAQLAFDFDDSAVQRRRRAKRDVDQLAMFAFAPNIDVHLHSPTEAVAVLSGSQPERSELWLTRLVGPCHTLANKRLGFPSQYLDRLLAVRPPAHVTLDAAALSVARALWANALGLRPLRVTRHRQRLMASSPRWPSGLGVVDAPWPAILTILKLGIPLDIDPKAKSLMTEKLAASGTHIARAWLAGSAVMIETDRPALIEAMKMPALAYAGDPDSGRYRLPLLAASALLDEPTIKIPDDLAVTIKKANARTRPLSSLEGFPWELYPFQARDAAQALRILETSGGVLLAGDMGSGKALDARETVYTPSGPKQIKDLLVGERVLGSNGESTEVTGVYPQGVRPVFRIEFSDDTSIVTDASHLWTIYSPDNPDTPLTMSTQQMLEAGLRDYGGRLRWYVPLISAPLQFETNEPDLPGYVLGVLLASQKLRARHPMLSNVTDAVAATAQSALRHTLTYANAVLVKKKDASYRITYVGEANRVRSYLTNLGLNVRQSASFVPDEYKYAPTSVRLSLLQGLLDARGEVTRSRSLSAVEFRCASPRLARDVAWIAHSLGAGARVYHDHSAEPGCTWRLALDFPDHISPFVEPHKAEQYRTQTKSPPRRAIVSITPNGHCPAVCISVSSSDELYVATNAVVTHNTTVSLAICYQLGLWPLLVVCPLAAMSTWARQLSEMGKSFYVATEKPSTSWQTIRQGKHDAVVISYDRLHAFIEIIEEAQFAGLVADELQRTRTPGSRRSRAMRTLAQSVPVRIGLSGTPLQNRIDDLLAPASFLVPGEFRPRASSKDLSDLYPGDPIEAIAEHIGTLMVRRRMEDTGVKLPNKTVRRLYVDLSAEQRHALADLEAAAEAAKDDGELDRMHAFAKLQKMRQIISCPVVANVGGGSPKVEAALDLVEEFAAMGRKCVVFCANRRTWTDLADGLKRLGIGYTGIWGSTPVKDRIANEKTFHNDPAVKVFIGTIQSCAESLTLSPTGTVVIHCDYVYNPSDLAQAEARVYRMNQTNPVDVIYLHATSPGGTLDDRMAEILDIKRALFAQVIDRTSHQDNTDVSYSLGDLVYLLTGSRDVAIDQREADRRAQLEREQKLKRHAKVTIYKNKGANKRSDDFFDDGSQALLLEDVAAEDIDEETMHQALIGQLGDPEDLPHSEDLEEFDVDEEDIDA